MYHSYVKRSLLAIVCFLSTFTTITAQNSNKENSPYSRFGIGEFRNGLNPMLRGMGSVSTAYVNEYAINTGNPASYASLKLTTYEVSAEGSVKNMRVGNENYTSGMATLSHINIGIPVSKHAALVLGLRPVARTYYSMSDTTDMPAIGTSLRTYSGDGSVNLAFLGVAGKYKNFSAGINVGYLFGTTRYSSVLSNLVDTNHIYNADFSVYNRIGGIHWSAGLLYEGKVHKSMNLRAGATFSLSQHIATTQDVYELSWRNSGTTQILDTAVSIKGHKGYTVLPFSYSLGVQLVDVENRWSAGLNFSMTQWGDYKQFDQKDSLANQSWKIGIGGEYTPNVRNLYKYYNRITYRLGFYYGTDYVLLRNTTLPCYAVTAGVSLPFRRTMDKVHLALEMGRRGTKSNGLIQENFYKFSVGISLNDKWFLKRKYD